MARVGITTDLVVEAGGKLANEMGFEAVTISELARRLGVKPPSLYSHVTSSHDLRTHMALLALTQLRDRAAEALAGRAGREALAAYANVFRDYAREHPGLYAAAQYPLDVQTAADSSGPDHSEMARSILRGYDVGGPDQTHAVRLLGSTIHGYVSLETSGGFAHSDPSSEVSWGRIIDALDFLLASWPAPR